MHTGWHAVQSESAVSHAQYQSLRPAALRYEHDRYVVGTVKSDVVKQNALFVDHVHAHRVMEMDMRKAKACLPDSFQMPQGRANSRAAEC